MISPALAPADYILIIGCGDIGRRVAKLECASGNAVIALARSQSTVSRLTSLDVTAIMGDLDRPESLATLSAIRVSTLYYFAPPPSHGCDDPRLPAALKALNPVHPPTQIVYISTTGVYGDCSGAWIDETHAINPRTDRAQRRVAAENRLREWSDETGAAHVVLRVPGIYGPGRLPAERIRQGVPVVREAESPWSNRIHSEDLAQACYVAARRGTPGRIYNISDGHPSTMTDYFFKVADQLGFPRPPEITLEQAKQSLGPGILSFLEESRRIDNRRMREELGIALQYPDLARGLPACSEEQAS